MSEAPPENKGRTSWLAHQFRQGQSGNPGGRPSGLAKLVKRQTKNGKEVIAFYLSVLRGEPMEMTRLIPSGDQPPITVTWRQTPDLRLRLEAARELRDTGWGKPAQAVELTDGGSSRRVATLVFLEGGDSDPLTGSPGHPEAVIDLTPTTVRPRAALPEISFESEDLPEDP